MKVVALALNTSREEIRNEVLHAIFLFAAILTAISAAFGAASIGDTLRFVMDFAVFSISVAGVITTAVLGVSLLSKEIDRRTVLRAYYDTGELTAAHEALRTAARLQPNEVEPHLYLAYVYADAGVLDRATEQVRRVLELAPQHPEARALRARLERESVSPP